MFIVDTTITVNWILQATAVSYIYSDFDVEIKKPDGDGDYYESAIIEEDFIAPTVSTNGAISYDFTPDQEGVWIVVLTSGVSALHGIHMEYTLRVSSSDTHIYQQVNLG